MSVYFITCRHTGAVKIGSSHDPHLRLKELQVSNPHDLKLEAAMSGSHAEERVMHTRFSDVRLRGEWFAITPEIEALIASNPPGKAPARVKASPADRRRGPIIFGESAREYEERLAAEGLARAQEAGKRWLEAQAVAGRITFPFRDEAKAVGHREIERGMRLVSVRNVA